MKVFRYILVSFLFVALVWWSFGGDSFIHTVGPMNELLTGILLFILFLINIGSVIMDMSKEGYGILPNRITFMSIVVLVLFFGSPLLINAFKVLLVRYY